MCEFNEPSEHFPKSVLCNVILTNHNKVMLEVERAQVLEVSV